LLDYLRLPVHLHLVPQLFLVLHLVHQSHDPHQMMDVVMHIYSSPLVVLRRELDAVLEFLLRSVRPLVLQPEHHLLRHDCDQFRDPHQKLGSSLLGL
jgi:hypothetical protein